MSSLRPLVIGALVLAEVALWQWRMLLAHRGRRYSAMLFGFVGAALQITAIAQVVTGVHDPLSVAAYAGGVGCGVLFGIVAGERLTPGRLEVTIVSSDPKLTECLWDWGWDATIYEPRSLHGLVATTHVDIGRNEEAQLWQQIGHIDPNARWTAKEVRTSTGISSGARKREGSIGSRSTVGVLRDFATDPDKPGDGSEALWRRSLPDCGMKVSRETQVRLIGASERGGEGGPRHGLAASDGFGGVE